MQYNTLLLIATLLSTAISAPIAKNEGEAAIINTRFLKYENQPRDAAPEEKNAVINTRFLKYEEKPRNAAPEEKKALINTRFLTYEAKPLDGPSKAA
ncbi:MAG: hypothetical protein Q9224_006098 [Gallowayella concinna]